nr:DUF421 domain-containing protein [Cohnella faecalis]
MELTAILLRTVIMYFIVFASLRLMGKREIGKLSVFDLVISFMIIEIAVIVIEEPARPFVNGAAPIILLAFMQLGIAIVTLKNRKARDWFDGKASVLISQGHLNKDEMRRQRYNLNDLMMQLRENKLTSVEEVELAVLESSGKLSVIPRDPKEEKPSDRIGKEPLSWKIRYELLPLPLIMDGKVQDESLEKIGKNRFWLNKELKEQE